MEEKKPRLNVRIKATRRSFRNWFSRQFTKFFGFESGIDITDEASMMVRRNVVMKNIIFVSGIIYTILLTITSIFLKDPINWLYTVISFLITFPINMVLKRLIFFDTKNTTRQNVAMYLASLYIFLASILIYIRLYNVAVLEIGGYLLIFYSLVVISLYQDKKLLSGLFVMLLFGMTVIHITCTYPIFQAINDNDLTMGSFWGWFFGNALNDGIFGGLLLRTLVFILFYLVLFAIVSISSYIQEKRIEELNQKKMVQQDFSNIIKNVFSILAPNLNIINPNKAKYVNLLSVALCNYCSLTETQTRHISEYSVMQLEYNDIYEVVNTNLDEVTKNYLAVQDKIQRASMIAKRIQLASKASDIVRSFYEQTLDQNTIEAYNKIQPELESQIILICDIYITLREPNSYKRPESHNTTIERLNKHFKVFFDDFIFERFIINNNAICQIYENS